jgi:hypothetical protein
MKAWLVGAAVAALLAGVPALAQTSSSSGSNQPYASQPSGGGAAVSGTSQGDQMQTQTPRKHRAARKSGSSTRTAQSKSQGSDDQTTEQLNRDELQRLQQSSR